MRSPSFLLAAVSFALSTNLVPGSVQAQAVFARAEAHTSDNSDGPTRPVKAITTEKVLLIGKITDPTGVLPGAVVTLTATKQMAVTNADGEFQFEVPANAGALDAVMTYAGYADEKMTLNAAAAESTMNLANARVIVMARRQQLKFYLKSARKQVKHSIKQVQNKPLGNPAASFRSHSPAPPEHLGSPQKMRTDAVRLPQQGLSAIRVKLPGAAPGLGRSYLPGPHQRRQQPGIQVFARPAAC